MNIRHSSLAAMAALTSLSSLHAAPEKVVAGRIEKLEDAMGENYSLALSMHWSVDTKMRAQAFDSLHESLADMASSLDGLCGNTNELNIPRTLGLTTARVSSVDLTYEAKGGLRGSHITFYQPDEGSDKAPVMVIKDPHLGTFVEMGLDKDPSNDYVALAATKVRSSCGSVVHPNCEFYFSMPREDADAVALQIIRNASTAFTLLQATDSYKIVDRMEDKDLKVATYLERVYEAKFGNTVATFTDDQPIGILNQDDYLTLTFTHPDGQVLKTVDYGLDGPGDERDKVSYQAFEKLGGLLVPQNVISDRAKADIAGYLRNKP